MRRRASALLALAALACGGGAPSDDGAADPRAGVRIVFVVHGQAADPFWSVVANGARDAGADLGVDVEIQSPTSFDVVGMAERIEAAVASRPDGLVVSIPDAGALGDPIRRAVAAGVPVVSINSGGDSSRSLGALVHVGQDEGAAGRAAGERLAEAGARRVLCIVHEVGNLSLDRRCDGLREGLAAAGGTVATVAVDLADPDDARERIAGALRDPAIDGALALGSAGAGPALAALASSGRAGTVRFATFDLSPEVLEGVRDGTILFAVDQQQYLQGYLPVVLLVKHRETGAMPGGGAAIATGPGFVTRETAAAVIDLAARGIR